MKEKIIAAVVAIAITLSAVWILMPTAHAEATRNAVDTTSIDVSSLTPEQKAQLIASANQMLISKNANVASNAREETEKWGELGVNMGKAAVGAAKELGVAANEFVQTPVGKVTMAMVVYKIIGKDVIGAITGFLIMLSFVPAGMFLVFRKHYNNVQYEYIPILWGTCTRRKLTAASSINGDAHVGYTIVGLLIVGLGLATGLHVMF